MNWKCHQRQQTKEFKKEFQKQIQNAKLSFYENPSEIVPRLFVGSNLTSKNKKILVQNGITHVLSCDLTETYAFEKDFVVQNINFPLFPSEDEDSNEKKIFWTMCQRQ